MKERIYIHSNGTDLSLKTGASLWEKMEGAGFTRAVDFSDADLIVCIGGDGAFLEAVHLADFPDTPFVGVNTGHLGFFQELYPEMFSLFLQDYAEGHYAIQNLTTVRCTVCREDGQETLRALNEIVVKAKGIYSLHLNISIGGSFIESYSGDGLLIATPAGSTAYNYSLGGSIVDPRIDLLQVTPIAPMNTTAYRSFTSSLLLPAALPLGIEPETARKQGIVVAADGFEHAYAHVDHINVELDEEPVRLLRLAGYDFWNKVKVKFL